MRIESKLTIDSRAPPGGPMIVIFRNIQFKEISEKK